MQLCKWTLLQNGLSRPCNIGDIKGKTNRGKLCLSEHCRNCFSQMPFDGSPPLLWICKALAPVIFTLPSDISDICFWFDLKKVWKYCRLLHFPIGKYFCERYKQIQLCSLLWSPQLGIEEKIKLDDFFQILSLTLALSPSRPKSIWRGNYEVTGGGLWHTFHQLRQVEILQEISPENTLTSNLLPTKAKLEHSMWKKEIVWEVAKHLVRYL